MTNRVYLIGRDELPARWTPQAGQRLSITLVALPGTSGEVHLDIDLREPGIEVDIAGLYICNADQKLDFNIRLSHNCGGCVSRQLFKGIAAGSSRVCFDGLIYVKQDAQKTKAFQENHTILRSAGAVVETRPQLEIYADDVECSHGATVGSLSDDELFYMRSRGIPEAQARELQMVSFISPVVERIESEELRAAIYASLAEC